MDDNDDTLITSGEDDDTHTRKLTEAIDETIHDDVCDILREVEKSRENRIDGDDFRHVGDEMKIFEKINNNVDNEERIKNKVFTGDLNDDATESRTETHSALSTPGALAVSPARVVSSWNRMPHIPDSSSTDSDVDGDGADQQEISQSPPLELEAFIVRHEIENIQTAQVQPAHVVQAEDVELFRQQSENEKNIVEGERKKNGKSIVVFAVVFLVIVVVIIVVILSLDNDNSPTQAPSGSYKTIFEYPNITQHVLFGDIETDCSDLKGNGQSFLQLRIQCGDVQDNIQLEDITKGFNCSIFKNNVLDCSGNSSAYGVIFTCGYEVKVNDLLVNGTSLYRHARVETSPIAGFGCQSFAKHSLTIARFCNNSVDKSSAQSWNLQSGVKYGSCSNSNEKYVGNWTLCEVEDTCTVTPCNLEMDQIFAYDILDEPTCENIGGSEQPYSPIDAPSFFDKIGSLIRLVIFNNTLN